MQCLYSGRVFCLYYVLHQVTNLMKDHKDILCNRPSDRLVCMNFYETQVLKYGIAKI